MTRTGFIFRAIVFVVVFSFLMWLVLLTDPTGWGLVVLVPMTAVASLSITDMISRKKDL